MPKNQWTIFSFVALCFFTTLIIGIPQVQAANGEGVVIDNKKSTTNSRNVDLRMYPTDKAYQMRVSNDEEFTGARWESLKRDKEWTLDFGAGTQTVYTQFRTRGKTKSAVYKDTIRLVVPQNMNVNFTINDNEKATNSRYVTLDFTYSEGVESVAISNSSVFTGIRFTDVTENMQWILSQNTGTKTVYIRFRDANETINTIQRSIVYKEPLHHIQEESLLKGDADTVYYLGYDGRIHPYLHSAVFHSYTQNFSTIKHISNQKLREYLIGEPVCMRPGTWLVKFQSLPRVYAVEPGCTLKPIRSEAEAFILYGDRWVQRILEIAPAFEGFYTIKERTTYDRSLDRDQDGIDAETEKSYGTSDLNGDSDQDRVSDYEEIHFWFTDPTRKDTDGDGVHDGDEILLRRMPSGSGTITSIPAGTYIPPQGSVIFDWWSTKKYYYSYQDGWTYFLSNKITDEPFVSNGFQSTFSLVPPFPLTITPRSGWHIYSNSLQIRTPLVTRYEKITPL
jgi:hypothetical protein